MKKFSIALAAAAVTAAPAFAGSMAEPMAEPVIAAPAPMAPSTDWTGFYVGGQVGTLNVEGEVDNTPIDDLEGDGAIYGLHAGYNYDLGNWVVGGEIDYDFADIDVDSDVIDGLTGNATAATLESVARLKFKAGYDAGPALLYATAGVAQARLDSKQGLDIDESPNGTFYGAGISYMATSNIMVGGEVLKHDFNDVSVDAVGEDADLDATTFTLRASFKF